MDDSLVPVRSYVQPQSMSPRFGVRTSSERLGTVGAHRHPYFELLFFAHSAGARQRVGSNCWAACTGSLFFISPMTPHEVMLEVQDRCYLLYFDLEFLRPDIGAPCQLDAELLRKAPELMPFACQQKLQFSIPEAETAAYEAMFLRMIDSSQRAGLCVDTVNRSLLGLLLADVTDRYRADVLRVVEASRLAGPVDRYVKSAIAFIDEQLAHRISLSDAAKAAAISPNYLAMLLRRETGNSFVELLTERRIAKASALLTYSTLRISQVASAVGFDDADYFSRRFRQICGQSPAAFRIERVRPLEAP